MPCWRLAPCSLARDLPSRVVVYLLLAACLFPETGYPGVWRTLTAALAGIATATPIDGTTMTVPDTPAVRTRLTKQAGNHGGTGYPQVRLVALVFLLACGTRTLIDAMFGPTTIGETTYTPRLLPSLRRA